MRSSVTAEDLAGASFAGQHAALLDVRGPVALGHAVGACWASLWTEWALHYRRRADIDQTSVAMAVVVQRLVPVVNVAGAMAAIRDGQPITVDGSTGQVLLEQEEVAHTFESLAVAIPA